MYYGGTSRLRVEDLTALNALYRPGPIQGGMIDDFIERKWGRRAVEYMLPELAGLLKETLGVIGLPRTGDADFLCDCRIFVGRCGFAAACDG